MNINTAELHWNSVVSTEDARYMCLDIKNFYLTAALKYYKYVGIPLLYFLAWAIEQYKLLEHAYNAMSRVGPTSGRHIGQQTPPKEVSTLWVLRVCEHTWAVET